MLAANILDELRTAGVRLTPLDGGRLNASPKERLNDRLRGLIREHKPALLALLSNPATDLEERAAILEYDGVLPRAEAEQLAARELASMAPPAEIAQPSACELEALRIESWLHALDLLPKACSDQGRQLERLTEHFWRGPWAHAALVAGWTDGELFNLDSGLVPAMARQRLHIVGIDEHGATLLTGQVFRRRRTSDPPWWLDERAIGE
jgi:hypothetical protein